MQIREGRERREKMTSRYNRAYTHTHTRACARTPTQTDRISLRVETSRHLCLVQLEHIEVYTSDPHIQDIQWEKQFTPCSTLYYNQQLLPTQSISVDSITAFSPEGHACCLKKKLPANHLMSNLASANCRNN